MLVNMLIDWAQQAMHVIVEIFKYIFPEYPKIGIHVVLVSLILFLFYTIRSGASSAAKMGLSALLTLIVLLYTAHILVKLFHVVV